MKHGTIGFIRDLRFSDLPRPVVDQARLCVLDLIGTACGGLNTKLSRIIRDHAVDQFAAGRRPARLIFDGRRVSAVGAALANGMTIDAFDAHDGHALTKGHAGAAVLPARSPSPRPARPVGQDFLTDIVVGYEVSIRAGIAQHRICCDYHTSGAWNALGAAAIGARRLKMDAGQTREALGIAEYHGPRSQMMRCIDFPTMVKDGSGWGAMTGVSAALLASDGFTGAPALVVESDKVADLWADLGQRWCLTEMYFKPYPVCRWAQPAVEAALGLIRQHGLKPADIASHRGRNLPRGGAPRVAHAADDGRGAIQPALPGRGRSRARPARGGGDQRRRVRRSGDPAAERRHGPARTRRLQSTLPGGALCPGGIRAAGRKTSEVTGYDHARRPLHAAAARYVAGEIPRLGRPDRRPGAAAEDRTRCRRARRAVCPRRRPSRAADRSPLVREQHRHGHVPEDIARHAAEHELAQPRVAEAAHDQRVGTEIGDARQQQVGSADVVGAQRLRLGLDAMLGEMAHQRLGRPGMTVGLFLGVDRHDPDLLGLAQQRQGVADGARRLAAAVPRHHDAAAETVRAADIGHDDDGPAAAEHQLFGPQCNHVARQFRIDLSDEGDVGAPREMPQFRDTRFAQGMPLGLQALARHRVKEGGFRLFGIRLR